MRRLGLFVIVLVMIATLLATACTPTPTPTPSPSPSPSPSPTVAPHPMVTVNEWASPFASSTYTVAFGIEDLAKKYHPWLRLPAAETPGFAYNIKSHANQPTLWEDTDIAAAALDIYVASKKLAPYDDQANPIVGYRRLVSHSTQLNWLVTLDPNIKTAADLAGKKIAIGTKSQTNVGVGPSYLLVEGMGLDPANIQYIGHVAAMTALLDGLVDVSIDFAYSSPVDKIYISGPTHLTLESSGKKFYYINFPEEAFTNATAKGLPTPSAVIPAGTFKDQAGDVTVYAASNGFYVKDVFPEDLAYELTKFWLEVGTQHLTEYSDYGKLVTPQGMIFGAVKAGLHPGALKAYEEAGLTIPEK